MLKELCQKISLEGLEEEDLAKLQPVVDELNQLAHVKLLGGEEKKESEKKVDRAWMLYQHVTAELALLASRKRTGEKTSHGGLVRSESLYFDTVEEEDALGLIVSRCKVRRWAVVSRSRRRSLWRRRGGCRPFTRRRRRRRSSL